VRLLAAITEGTRSGRTVDSKEQRVLDALWQARYVDRENDGWTYVYDLSRKKIAPNRLGFHMSSGTICVVLWRLEEQGLVESKWIQVRPDSHPYPRSRAYRITEHGHRERARHPVRGRQFLLGKLRPQPEEGR
jgi:DNA-binding PadR family transcriptional regulator